METDPIVLSPDRIANYRPLFVTALGVAAGILACGLLSGLGAALLAILALAIGTVLFIKKFRRTACFFAAVLFGLAAAFLGKPRTFAEGNYRVSGVVIQIDEGSEGIILTLKSASLNGNLLNKRVRLSVDSLVLVNVGDKIEADAHCRMPQAGTGLDEMKLRLSAGIGCIAQSGALRVVSHGHAPLARLSCAAREGVVKRIERAFGEDAGFFTAVLLGDKSELEAARISAFRASGTAHLLAISGFHMGVVVGVVGALVPKRKRGLRFGVTCAVMLLYCTLAAYAPGFVRAAIMTFFLMLSALLDREGDSLTSLSAALLLILAFNPYQLYSIGLQLSFSACFGIVLFSRSISTFLEKHRFPGKLASALATTVSALFGTFVFQLRYYSSFSPYTVLANLIAVPVFSLVVILGLLVTALCFISPPAAAFLAAAPRGLLFAIEKFLGFLSHLPLASMEFNPASGFCCLIWLAALFALSEYTLRSLKKRLALASVLFGIFTSVYVFGIIRA